MQKYENNSSIARCDALRRIVPAGDGRYCYSCCLPQLRPGFDIGKPMETRDIIIICMLSAACLMVVLCKTATDAIILTSTFRAGMSSLAVILGIVTLGTTLLMRI